ncbi:hemoglobin/transferrin/lactoferrin receptor protein [Wenyingzhuangia heitensis]|uniref:Hemoglobin/transferrin/lactoferrin receptor protein n=1 Tax=Wenyingzhuangia heitensis TaxID=1487859 RepID=A0ABX0U7D4_9FLAO|nr:TonB-dependent receptor [Wenyingzhuangia heitensis]NIJ43880.1 hemoglobin/transferrin/lactoferrin receptor protein [Wenyingzhuangia heitensis]
MFRILVAFLLISISSFSQKIRVIDSYTQERIEGVEVFDVDNQKTKISNASGEVQVSLKNATSTFIFKHKDYCELTVLGQDIDKEILLKPRYEGLQSVVLSVARVAEKKQRIPEKIEIITKKEIENLSPQTSADMLANTPGVRVQKSQFGGGSPVIRGMESNRVLLVVDGVRMNNAIYRNGHLQNSITVSPFAIERAEVVFGPTSVAYGSDALGGVIHYYTKSLNYSTKLYNKNEVFYRHSTVNNEQTVAFSSSSSHKKWASFSNISYSSFDDLKMGKNRTHGYDDWGKVYKYSQNTDNKYYPTSSENKNPNIQKNTGYHQLDILQKFKLPINDAIDVVLNGQFSKSSDIPNFGKLNDEKGGDLKFAEWYYGPQQRVLVSAQTKFKDYKSLLQNGSITLAYQNILESRINRQMNSLDRTSRFEAVDVYSLNSDFYKLLTKDGNRKLFYGIELVHNDVNSTAKGETLAVNGNKILGVQSNFNADTRYPDGGSTYSSAAIYTSYRQLLDKKNTLNLGVRLTNTLLKANWNNNVAIAIPDNAIKLQNTALTGSIGYIHRPKNNDKISVVLSKGFRAPNVDDVGKIRSKSGKLTVPNTKLKPEHLYSLEAGYDKCLFDKRLKLNINTYYTLLDNYIARATSSEFGTTINYDGDVFENEAILANTNQGQAYIYGGTFGMQAEIANHLKCHMSITYTQGKSYDTHQPLSSIPPMFSNASLGWYKSKYDVILNYRMSLAKKLSDYNIIEGIDNLDETPNEEGTPAWQIVGLSSNYRITNYLKLQLQLQNIFDIHYKEFGSSISAPGRNLVAAVAYSF